ncbi:hypothetical protein LMG31506_00241 [Cupriavidus yeoncheonensis]|uniref:Uncharacterized protein n=1 Tax=Cupriavidus yeoncheonensis TaxID=1462994 RepID=A0A916N1F0_9BURK|nr:hypothetical protein [Cupriavidus yeoncheonensis]CAG2126925.1 hypothetical protein LMG31506_00241 [Cupriavidus yeoncheonensis]
MSNVVKFMHSDMVNAPTVFGNAGGTIPMLDACLKDGWGSQTLSSLVVAGGVATATFGTAFPYEIQTVVLIAGATPSGLNGEKKVLSLTSSTITFDATGISDQTATGTITARMAPLGWAKSFSGTNKAVYTSPAAAYSGGYLRVDDTSTLNARVVAYEGMYDVDNGVNPYPTAALVGGGLYWGRSNVADATTRKWFLAGDDRGFYLWLAPQTAVGGVNGISQYFGDLIAKNTTDKFMSTIAGGVASNVANAAAVLSDLGYCNTVSPTSASGVFLPRATTGAVGAITTTKYCALAAANQSYSGLNINTALTYPNGGDNGLLLSPTVVTGAQALRGVLPGWYMTPQNVGPYFSHRDPVPGTDDYPGKRFLALRHAPPGDSGSQYGYAFIDVSGPWR